MAVGTVSKYMFQKRLVLPLMNLFAFIFDITKDLGLAFYMAEILLRHTSKDLASTDDYNAFSTYLVSLCLGQILISSFAVKNKAIAFSLCPHDDSSLRTMLFLVML